jgi:hypothetical protein
MVKGSTLLICMILTTPDGVTGVFVPKNSKLATEISSPKCVSGVGITVEQEGSLR